MKLVGLMPVRNEDWILPLSARVALQWCDELLLWLHACTDRSKDIAAEIEKEAGARVRILYCDDPTWNEMDHRQNMLICARTMKPTHIAMIDADEVLTADRTVCVRDWCFQTGPGQMLELPGYNLRGGMHSYHANGVWGNRWFSVVFRDDPAAHWAGDKFHSREPAGVNWQKWRPIHQGQGGVMHFWGASERRLKAKHALYKVTERLRWPQKSIQDIDSLYNLWRDGRGEQWTYNLVPGRWTHVPQNGMTMLSTVNAEPWQEAEVKRLVGLHGKEHFAGLDLFGLV
jgi:glycosyl transferase family 2